MGRGKIPRDWEKSRMQVEGGMEVWEWKGARMGSEWLCAGSRAGRAGSLELKEAPPHGGGGGAAQRSPPLSRSRDFPLAAWPPASPRQALQSRFVLGRRAGARPACHPRGPRANWHPVCLGWRGRSTLTDDQAKQGLTTQKVGGGLCQSAVGRCDSNQ